MPTPLTAEQKGDLAWKWLLRLVGVGAFVYVLVAKGADTPLAVYMLIAGMVGLPSVVSWQSALNARKAPAEDES